MFDKKLYVETCSALHASEDTLTEVLKITSQNKPRAKYLPRPAVAFSLILILLISPIALAAGSQIRYGGWPHHASLQDVEKMGFHYPEQLGEYQLSENSPSRIHTAPAESSKLTAWFKPDYTWMSLNYRNKEEQSLSVSFGKIEDPLWAYCFGYSENTGIWVGADNPDECANVSTNSRSYIENVTEYEYKGCTIYLADRITEYFDHDVIAQDSIKNSDLRQSTAYQQTEIEAHWLDSAVGLCFSMISNTDYTQSKDPLPISDTQNMTQAEMLNYVKSIIDHSR